MAPVASGLAVGNSPTRNKDFLRHDLVTLSEMWYNHCNTKSGENGVDWKSQVFFEIDGTLASMIVKDVWKTTKDAIKIAQLQGASLLEEDRTRPLVMNDGRSNWLCGITAVIIFNKERYFLQAHWQAGPTSTGLLMLKASVKKSLLEPSKAVVGSKITLAWSRPPNRLGRFYSDCSDTRNR